MKGYGCIVNIDTYYLREVEFIFDSSGTEINMTIGITLSDSVNKLRDSQSCLYPAHSAVIYGCWLGSITFLREPHLNIKKFICTHS